MFNFEHFIDLPLIWGGLIATAVFMYVVLDGFDLGIGILFPFAPTDNCRNRMVNSIAPFWDGNETWLVLGGGGLFAAFPLAYALIFPALYIPITAMLICLIFRGVAFEFRFKANTSRSLWDKAFHFGSLGAAFSQGLILGGYIQGITVADRSFAGGAFDWLSGFSIMCGIAVMAGYMLLGATWLILKTDGETQIWARKAARYVLTFVALFMAIVCIWVPFLEVDIGTRWFGENFFYILPLPLLSLVLLFTLVKTIPKGEIAPFAISISLFALCYLGLGYSVWPRVVPYDVTLWEAAAANTSLSLMLVGITIMLPLILAYTAWCYYVFRGKVSHEPYY
jgi:cytochrome d ubiquinol oxidase subunit II